MSEPWIWERFMGEPERIVRGCAAHESAQLRMEFSADWLRGLRAEREPQTPQERAYIEVLQGLADGRLTSLEGVSLPTTRKQR